MDALGHVLLCGCVAASSCETYDYPQHGGGSAVQSVESMHDGYSSYLVSWPYRFGDEAVPGRTSGSRPAELTPAGLCH